MSIKAAATILIILIPFLLMFARKVHFYYLDRKADQNDK